MNESPKPKYDTHEMIVLRAVQITGRPVTAGTIEAALLAGGAETLLNEEQCQTILEGIRIKGGVEAVKSRTELGEIIGYRLTTQGASDLGPMAERGLKPDPVDEFDRFS